MAIRLNSMSMNKDYIHDNKEQLACQGGHADFMDLATEAQRKCAYNLKAGYGYVSHGDWLDPAKVEFDDALGIPYAWKSSMLTRDEPPTSFVFRGRTASQAVLASAEVVVVQADAAIYAEPAVKASGAPLKKGSTVKVHLGRKNLGKDQTYEWCEAQIGNEAKHHWVPCKALPAHVRVAKAHPSRTIAAKGQKPKKPRGN